MKDRNFRGWKMQDWNRTDKSAGLENIAHYKFTYVKFMERKKILTSKTYEREKETTADEQHMRGIRNSKEMS